MQIAFISPSVSRMAGGIFEIERRLAQSLAEIQGTSMEIYGLEDSYTDADLSRWSPLKPDVFPVTGPRFFGYSPALRNHFLQSSADIAHLHALWMYTSILVHQWSRKQGKSYVTTLNGMLDSWALKNSRWKKWLAGMLYERSSLGQAGCIQVNSANELMSARAFGLDNPVCIIPNGIDLPTGEVSYGNMENTAIAQMKEEGKRILLYLGRIHPKKGLRNLIDAWSVAGLDKKQWVLVIAGWDQGRHERALKKQAGEAGMDDSVRFCGPVYGAVKEALFSLSDAFVLPSYSEGQPMTALEAWSYAKPVIMTKACNLESGYSTGAAMQIEPSVMSIKTVLQQLDEMPVTELAAMGEKGRTLVEKQFSWPVVAKQLRDVYLWLLGGGQRPGYVELQ